MIKPLNRAGITDAKQYPLRILQFGGGNFLRAFIGWMVEVLNEESDFNSDIVIVKPTAKGTYRELREQQGLYHVLLQGLRKGEPVSEIKRIHCVRKILNPYNEWKAFLELAEIPTFRFIISNTTEAGIQFNREARQEDRPPEGFPAKLTLWLYHRFHHFGGDMEKGCVVLPCELIEENGAVLRDCILEHGREWGLDEEFLDWINRANYFCDTLVDRIVSGFPGDTASSLWEELGFRDQLLVAGELYHSWVIQGPEFLPACFPSTRTHLNIRFVKNLSPYREMKVRILNGAHILMVPVGYLLGFRQVHECLHDPGMRVYLEALLRDEICSVLDLPPEDVRAFSNEVLARFQNPFIRHELMSIALNALPKFKTRVLPTIIDYHCKYNKFPDRILFAFAALLYFYKGTVNGLSIPLNDDPRILDFFRQVWADYSLSSEKAALELVNKVLNFEYLWDVSGTILPASADQVAGYLYAIDSMGIEDAIRGLGTC